MDTSLQCADLVPGQLFLGADVGGADIAEWSVFEPYFEAAKANDAEAIIKTFTDADGSAEVVREQISSMDKYSNYRSVDLIGGADNSVSWGNYRLRLFDYNYNGRQVSLPETVFCDGAECAMSLLLENTTGPDNLMAQLLADRVGRGAFGACPDASSMVSIDVVPASGPEGQPAKALVAKNAIESAQQAGGDQLAGFLESCLKPALSAENRDAAANPGCIQAAVGNAGMPVISLEESNTRVVAFTGFAMEQMLLDAPLLEANAVLSNGDTDVFIMPVSSPLGAARLVVLPLKQNEIWQDFFSTPAYLVLSHPVVANALANLKSAN